MIKNYYKPTPVKLRKFGDSLLAISTFIGEYAAFADQKWVAITAFGLGVLGKFMTNFWKQDV